MPAGVQHVCGRFSIYARSICTLQGRHHCLQDSGNAIAQATFLWQELYEGATIPRSSWGKAVNGIEFAPPDGANEAAGLRKAWFWRAYASMVGWAVEPDWAARSRSAVEGVPVCIQSPHFAQMNPAEGKHGRINAQGA